MKLRSSTMQLLKEWNERYPTILFDCKFVRKSIIDVFGIERLAKPPVFGTRICENLDATKLNFVRGNF